MVALRPVGSKGCGNIQSTCLFSAVMMLLIVVVDVDDNDGDDADTDDDNGDHHHHDVNKINSDK